MGKDAKTITKRLKTYTKGKQKNDDNNDNNNAI